MNITLDQARTIIAGAQAKGRGEGFKPLSVVVLDAGGHLTTFEREDGSSCIGAVGVTGDTSDNDEIAALAGIESAGLAARTG